MARPPPSLLIALPLLLAACGGEASEPPLPAEPFAVRVAESTVASAPPARTATVSGAAVSLLGMDGEARPVVVQAGREVSVLRGAALERRRLFAGPGDPVFLGEIRAIRPRSAGGAWLAADAGLFVVDTQYVLPVAAEIGPLVDAREVAEGPLAGLWLVGPSALFLVLEAETALFEIPELLGPQSAFAIDPAGRRALVVAGREVLVLEPDGPDLDVLGLAFDPGAPRAIAATRGALWLATVQGLFSLDHAGPVEAWRRVDLAEGPLLALQLDADASDLHALDDAGRVVRVSAQESSFRAEITDAGQTSALAADGRGGVWVARTTGGALRLEGRGLDAAPTFERDVRPFVEANCATCHSDPGADYTIYENFAPRAQAALARIVTGDMPRCENDQRCPEDRQLEPGDYAILERWIEEGLLR